MNESIKPDIGEDFKPVKELKTLYYIYLLFGILIGVLPWLIPVLLFAPFPVKMGFTIATLIIIVFIIYWIPKYYESITYKLTKSEMEWQRGVWFKQNGTVPYNRITNIDIGQGPVSRKFDIASLKIHTAGYSASTSSEISINGIKNYSDMKEYVIDFVREKEPISTETYPKKMYEPADEKNTDSQILDELVKIRKLLENFSKNQ